MVAILIKNRPKLNDFFFQLTKGLKMVGNNERSLKVLTIVLHAFRDSLELKSAILVQCNLPVYLKSIYAEDWKPFEENKEFSLADIHVKLNEVDGKARSENDVQEIIKLIFALFEQCVPEANMTNIKKVYPAALHNIVFGPIAKNIPDNEWLNN